MSNCDFGSPCDCSECSQATYKEKCPKCGKEHTKVVRAKMTMTTGRKGERYYDQEVFEDIIKLCEVCSTG